MAREQRHKGDPEQKRYVLFDSFSGGMNTTAVDEAVLTNEYRRLENVDLSTEGLIQNRKGFANFEILNQIIATDYQGRGGDYSIIDLSDFTDYCLIKVVKDDSNIINVMLDSTDYNDFEEKTLNTEYTIDILLIAEDGADTKAFSLIIYKEGYTVYSELQRVWTFSDTLITNNKMLGVDTAVYDDKIYLPLNQVNNTLEGFGVYDTTTRMFSIIDSTTNYYVPNPYEVTNIGFNLLAEDPLNARQMYETGAAELRGIYLTDIADSTVVYSEIPPNGLFHLNVIYKGTLDTANLKIVMYIEDSFGVKEYLDSEISLDDTNLLDGVFRYKVTARLLDASEVTIEVRQVSEITDYDESYTNIAAVIYQYDVNRKNILFQQTPSLFIAYTPTTGTYGYELLTAPVTTRVVGVTTIEVPACIGINLPYVITSGSTIDPASPVSTIFKNTVTYAIRKNVLTSPATYTLVIVYYTSLGVPTQLFADVSPSVTFTGGVVSTFEGLRPSIDNLLRIGDTEPYTYYRWNKGTDGLATDFDLQDISDEDYTITSFINTFDVGTRQLNALSTIDTTKAKMIVIKDRLVVYSGNTLAISDAFNFNYFPHNNYVTLSLNSDDSIQKIAYFRGAYIIFTKDRLYRMSGGLMEEDFTITLINDSIGCVAPNSVRSMNNTLVFLSRDGLYTIKQNFYMDGLENVEKIDKNIKGVIPLVASSESLIYNEQYLLLMKNTDNTYYKTLKQYYNMEYRSKTYPYVLDEYSVIPDLLFQHNGNIFAIKNGLFYVYDVGYTDFMPDNVLEEDIPDYSYKMSIVTPNYSIGYPTHDKKFKNIYLKTDSEKVVPVYITLFINNSVWKTPYQFAAIVNDAGEIEYYEILGRTDYNTTEMATTESESNIVLDTEETTVLTVDPDLVLGFFDLGLDKLGTNRYQVHKIVVSGKGKTLALKIEQKLNEYFAVQNIGILYKLGKVRETR